MTEFQHNDWNNLTMYVKLARNASNYSFKNN